VRPAITPTLANTIRSVTTLAEPFIHSDATSLLTLSKSNTKDTRNVAFWTGNGGSMSYVDLDARMAFAFAPNRWITGPHEQQRSLNILSATYACLAKLAADS